MSILIIDDTPSNIQLLTFILEDEFKVLTALSGEEGLRVAKSELPEAIILDVQMPNMNGFEVLEQLKQDPSTKDIPVIMLTANRVSDADIAKGIQQGAFDYLTKPIDNDLITLKIKSAAKSYLNANRLKASNNEKRSMIEAMNDCVITLDSNRNILTVNSAVKTIFNREEASVIGKKLEDLINPEDIDKIESCFQTCVLNNTVSKLDELTLHQAIKKGGENFPYQLTITEIQSYSKKAPSKNGTTTGAAERKYIACIQDLTERVEAEESLRRSSKLQSVGALVGGIAHDFNNLIGIISGNLELLEMNKDSEKADRWIQKSLKGAERATVLTRRLLQFSRKDATKLSVVSINAVISDLQDLLEKSLQHVVNVDYQLEEDLWGSLVDPNDLEDVIINISLNARDSFTDNQMGKLTITSENVEIDSDNAIGFADEKPLKAEYTLLRFTDTGCGMPKEVINQAFDPFFTTKEQGKGTGLGLSMVYGFVKRSKGFIDIESEVGVGTTISIYLPRSYEPITTPKVSTRIFVPTPSKRQETILLVDDQFDLIEVSATRLNNLGYNVLIAESVRQANIILNSNIEIDMLLTDVIMPGDFTGFQLAEESLKNRPDLKVIFMTGFELTEMTRPERVDKFAILHKPFKLSELIEAVEEEFAGEPSSIESTTDTSNDCPPVAASLTSRLTKGFLGSERL